MKKLLEGSQAIAQVVNLCRPGVISAYPITPQTHIVENLSKLKANGEASYEYIRTESEFAAASVVLGASATGVRAYTATTSQGLLLMTEVLYNIAGMEMPVVITCANRAVGAPINIWNDQQDAYSVRDSGWIMLFANDLQEAVDLHILAFKVAERISQPVMVNMDGFFLTHTTEEVEIPDQKKIDRYLPVFKPKAFLDPKDPKIFGYLATPKEYLDIRLDLDKKIKDSAKIVKEEMKAFQKVFGRKLDFTRSYKAKDAKTLLVSTGAIFGTCCVAVDKLRKLKSREKVGLVNINLLRPFPNKQVYAELKSAKKIIVLNRALSLGAEGILTTEVKSALYGLSKAKIVDEIVGLGGRNVSVDSILEIVNKKIKN